MSHIAVADRMRLVGFDYEVETQSVSLRVEWRPRGKTEHTDPPMSGGALLADGQAVLVAIYQARLPVNA